MPSDHQGLLQREWKGSVKYLLDVAHPGKKQSLEEQYPEVAKQWHPTKNGTLKPCNVAAKSNKKAWWKCDKGHDHEWQSVIASRANPNSTCPICTNRIIVPSNSLAVTFPSIAAEWHPTKNGELTPQNIGGGSGKKVWWKCPEGEDHEWQCEIERRIKRGHGCPVCSGSMAVQSNCLQTTHPELAAEWHPTKNKSLLPTQVTQGSHRKVWWKCAAGEDHEWQTRVSKRAQLGRGCLICTNQLAVESNSLATTHPEIAALWHPSKNGELTPFDVTYGTGRRVWFKCEKGDDHEWQTVPKSIVHGTNCAVCSGKRIVLSNCLVTTHPEMAAQWHPVKNGALTAYDVGAGSNKNIWWKCDKGEDHEWVVRPNSRVTFKNKCPFCTLTPQSRQELTITFELMLFFPDINPKGFKAKLKGRLKSIDIFMPELNLGVEFDGSYWHKDKRALDKLKTEKLREAGFEIIRIREEPLKKIHDIDIISAKPYNGKLLTNAVLSRIQELYSLPAKTNRKIAAYLGKEGLQNEAGLEAYVEQILEEKAKRSK